MTDPAPTPLTLLDTFAGIGGFSYAAEHLLGGFRTVAFVEQAAYPRQVLSHHWPHVPIHDDIRTFNASTLYAATGLHTVDVITAGFPCQDISTAGKGAGIAEGTRSGLFHDLMRTVRDIRPRFIVLENVAAIVNRGLDVVLASLAEAGYDAEWACIRASDVGACHRRDRWWCVAHAPHLQRHGGPAQHPRQPGSPPLPEPGDGGGADVTPHTQSLRRGAGTRQSASTSRHEEQGVIHGASTWDPTTPHPHHHDADTGLRVGPGLRFTPVSSAPDVSPNSTGAEPRVSRRDDDRWCHTPHLLTPDYTTYVSQPVIRRGDDGLPAGVDTAARAGRATRTARLRALGNAVVPHCAAVPLNRVAQLAAVT